MRTHRFILSSCIINKSCLTSTVTNYRPQIDVLNTFTSQSIWIYVNVFQAMLTGYLSAITASSGYIPEDVCRRFMICISRSHSVRQPMYLHRLKGDVRWSMDEWE